MASTEFSAEPATPQLGRRLVWHGLLLFLLGLVGGMFVFAMANPRMGVSAHVGTVLNGTFLIALGAAWGGLVLSPRAQRWAVWLLVLSSYGGSIGLFLAAVLGTHDTTPIHGAAQSASQWKESLVMVFLNVSGLAIVVGTAIALRGFGRRARR
jgi:hydroxylaminobenzene mutase